MKNSPKEGAAARDTLPATLLEVVRNARLYPLLRALLNDEVSRLDFPGALEHFTYRLDGEEVLADPKDVECIAGAVGKALGKPKLRATARVLPKYPHSKTLVFPAAAKQLLLLELLALCANLSAGDLATLPPPVDLQLQT